MTRETGASNRSAPVRVRLDGVQKTFPGGVVAVDSLDLEISPGEFVALVGPSGCGKSTILRLVAGLDKPDSGVVSVDGAARGAVGYVFQDAHLLPWRTVAKNVELPLELANVSPDEAAVRALDALERVGLADARDRYPAALSGGMRMRASLARALVTGPSLLLLDEPFAALDEITRQKLDDELRELWAKTRRTVLFVTHSIVEAAFLAERVVVLTRRPARIAADRRVELPFERTGPIRASAEFARENRILFEALERGSVESAA